uniref:B3 domain-containing protein n=2 Tax=Noccaea caerulescens TaxID=107243 RepID=A0A1J3H3I8_NOCCA
MLTKSDIEKLQEDVSKPSFCKSVPLGGNWNTKSMRIIPEEIERSMPGALEHKVVFTVRWENSWLLWVEREKKGLVIEEEDWDEFVDDNHLGPNDILVFTHEDTECFEVQIIKNGEKEIMSVPLEVQPETEPLHPKPHQETTTATASTSANGGKKSRPKQGCHNVENPEQYLLNPQNAYLVRTLSKTNVTLYFYRELIEKYDLKFGPVNSAITYFLPDGKVDAFFRIYSGYHCFTGWGAVCRRLHLKRGDRVVCEFERPGGMVTALRVHLVNE